MFVSFFQLPGPMPTKRMKLWSPVIDPERAAQLTFASPRPQSVLSHEPSGLGTLLPKQPCELFQRSDASPSTLPDALPARSDRRSVCQPFPESARLGSPARRGSAARTTGLRLVEQVGVACPLSSPRTPHP